MTEHSNTDQLKRETEAARVLREQLIAMVGPEWEEVVRDTLEGETNLRELIVQVVDDIAQDEAYSAGIDAHIATMQARKERLKKRIEYHRSAVLNAMTIGEIKTLPLAIATLSRAAVAPKVEIIATIATIFSGEAPSTDGPKISRAASAKGAFDAASVAAGITPMIETVAST